VARDPLVYLLLLAFLSLPSPAHAAPGAGEVVRLSWPAGTLSPAGVLAAPPSPGGEGRKAGVVSLPAEVNARLLLLSFDFDGPGGAEVVVTGTGENGKEPFRVPVSCWGRPGAWSRNEKLCVFPARVRTVRVAVPAASPRAAARFRRWKLTRYPSPSRPAENLVVNGGFEAGGRFPDGWSGVDGLTVFWEKEPDGNRLIRMDTDVYKAEFMKRKKELAADPLSPPWKKSPTSGRKYNTVAGTYGASLFSAPVPVERGAVYRLRVRFKGPSRGEDFVPKVFVKGYARVRGRYRKVYQAYKACRGTGGAWKRYERTFSPTAHTPFVEYVVVQLYAYWPPGEYFFDDVEVRPCGKKEAGDGGA